jgi:serine/threonine-protein kinase
VAIKILPPAFAADADRMARFEREAKVLASLNHPNIAAINAVEEGALVMELVEGEMLAGPLPIETALNYARQIAEALEAAHDKGITHRDLKPANVKATQQGVAKVLDFGLAAVAHGSGSAAEIPANSPTLTMRATEAGLIMGTAAYMSLEQAAGKPVDKRADIWSFGVVLWELLTGKRLFDGETVSHTLADVLRAEINFSKLPAETPAAVRELLRRCLDRDVRNRLRDIGEAHVTLQRPRTLEATGASVAERTVRTRRVGYRIISWTLIMSLTVFAATLSWIHFREKLAERLVEGFTIPAPKETAFNYNGFHGGPVEVSPDGHRLVFSVLMMEGKTQLWVRALASLTSVPLAGTEGASFPFWSADSTNIGFFADASLSGSTREVDPHSRCVTRLPESAARGIRKVQLSLRRTSVDRCIGFRHLAERRAP